MVCVVARGRVPRESCAPQGLDQLSLLCRVPDTTGGTPHAGAIKFGESGAGLGPDRETVARRIQPQAGMLVLFPSYMWHGTEAFTGPAIRITTPFDVLPA
ncbi:putative 2OG-Fe(II) oxygenase [Kordiimonas gwangyangensis]|uniref:putative 2OG-Fe(II) oxygenase n=1 Tax=Kordiimonas gwangyangensis TaxID=288022 RepID=UPI0034E23B7D